MTDQGEREALARAVCNAESDTAENAEYNWGSRTARRDYYRIADAILRAGYRRQPEPVERYGEAQNAAVDRAQDLIADKFENEGEAWWGDHTGDHLARVAAEAVRGLLSVKAPPEPVVVETVEARDALPAGTVVRSAAGTIACRHKSGVGVVFGDERPFDWSLLAAPLTVLTPATKPTEYTNYHDDYECAEGESCLGQLRHEAFPTDRGLPDSTPLKFALWEDGDETPLELIGSGYQAGECSLDFMRASKPTEPTRPFDADCWRCANLAADGMAESDPERSVRRMYLCPGCGNKRCAKARDHEFRCDKGEAERVASEVTRQAAQSTEPSKPDVSEAMVEAGAKGMHAAWFGFNPASCEAQWPCTNSDHHAKFERMTRACLEAAREVTS